MASSGKYRVMSPAHHGDRGLVRPRARHQADSSLPPTLLSGVIWHQAPGIFSKWREVFLILNRDSLRWHHIQKTASINHHQVGPTIASINLVLVADVSFVERRGYLTISIEAGGVGRNCFRRSSSVRQWGELIREAVLRKREEFGCVSLTRLSLSSSAANLTEPEPEPEDRHRPAAHAPVRRFYRSRSSGNLVDRERDEVAREAGDIKRCLIQEDEEDVNNRDRFETDFQRRWMVANRMNGFERYT